MRNVEEMRQVDGRENIQNRGGSLPDNVIEQRLFSQFDNSNTKMSPPLSRDISP